MTSDQKVAHAKEGQMDLTKSKDTMEIEESMATDDSEVVVVDPNSVSFLRKGFNQNIVAGIVAFTGPGLFNAMQGLGNAGGSDPTVREYNVTYIQDMHRLMVRFHLELVQFV
jgi:DNA-binding transcriptional regulator of glucitol operon